MPPIEIIFFQPDLKSVRMALLLWFYCSFRETLFSGVGPYWCSHSSPGCHWLSVGPCPSPSCSGLTPTQQQTVLHLPSTCSPNSLVPNSPGQHPSRSVCNMWLASGPASLLLPPLGSSFSPQSSPHLPCFRHSGYLYRFLLLCCLCRQLPLPQPLWLLAAPFGNRFLIDPPPPISSSPLIHPPHLQQHPLKQLCPFISLPCWKKINPLPHRLLCSLPWEFQTFQKYSSNLSDNATTHRTAPCAVFGLPFPPRYPAYDHPPSLEFLSCTPNLALQGVSHSGRASMHPALMPTSHPSFAGFTFLFPSSVQLLYSISINSVLQPPERVPSWHTVSLLLQVARVNAWTPTTTPGKTEPAPVNGKQCGNMEALLVALAY